MLLAVPNVSEGRDLESVSRLGAAFDAAGVTLLDIHTDPDHNRAVFTLAGEPGPLADALLSGAAAAIEAIDMRKHHGVHPCVGALDVCPVVWLDGNDREAAEAEALTVAEGIGRLGVPVFLYGDLASGPGRSERSLFRRGGVPELTLRMGTGELPPDRGPAAPHPTAGATLVTARPPLAAFNIVLDSADPDVARSVAAQLREGGGGLAGVRAIGRALADGRTQVSANVHDPAATPLGRVVSEVRRLAGRHGALPIAAEVVGLVPEAALVAYPNDVPIAGFDPERHVIERRLASLRG
jgi:glutamate formiminotransferase / 5-formyltetrahydrofolate cyclo-ligase